MEAKITRKTRQYKHPGRDGRITIAGHPQDGLQPKTLTSILTAEIARVVAARSERRETPHSVHRFLIVIEYGKANYSAYVPDLPGCIATGKTLEELRINMKQAMELHIRGMYADQEPLYPSQMRAEYLDIPLSKGQDLAAHSP